MHPQIRLFSIFVISCLLFAPHLRAQESKLLSHLGLGICEALDYGSGLRRYDRPLLTEGCRGRRRAVRAVNALRPVTSPAEAPAIYATSTGAT